LVRLGKENIQMIKLIFSIQREVFRITIIKKNIYYSDRRWKNAIRLIPKDTDFIKKVIMSRNRVPKNIITLFELTDEERKQYEKADSEEQLAGICINDCRKKGAKLLKQEIG
jgi:hypothetical protein